MGTTVSIIALIISSIVSVFSIALSWGKINTKLDSIEKDTKTNQEVATKAQDSLSRKLESTGIKIDDLIKSTSDVKEKLIKVESELNGIQNMNQVKFQNIEGRVNSIEKRLDETVSRHSDEIKDARHLAKDALSAISLFRAERTRIQTGTVKKPKRIE